MSSSLAVGSSYKYTASETETTDIDDEQRTDELATTDKNNDQHQMRQFTRNELMAFDGHTPGQPIYLAVLGNVYDVSTGRKFYGPGKFSVSVEALKRGTG